MKKQILIALFLGSLFGAEPALAFFHREVVASTGNDLLAQTGTAILANTGSPILVQ